MLGTNIDPATNELPADGVIQVSFDRYLLPSTITRQSYVVTDNTNKPLGSLDLKTIYDPVARTVTITGPGGPGAAWLTPGVEYKLALLVPRDNTDLGGFRAIDRSPLDSTQLRQFPFRASAPTGVTTIDPPVDFCADVLPIFQAKCGGGGCHGPPATGNPPRSAASLILTSNDGVRVTAKGRVAQGANTGGRAFAPSPDGPVFGVDMALIQPGSPGASWLMYKVEMAPHPVVDAGAEPNYACTPPAGSPPLPAKAAPYQPGRAVVPQASDAERERLGNFILGREMPYPPGQPLSFQQRERIRIWIANGAETRECGGCGVIENPDGGT